MSELYAYYPGCSALKSATEVDLSTRRVLQVLGLRYTLLDQAACCGSRECGGLRVVDEPLSLANNARTLAMAEAAGASTLIDVCSTCQLELGEAAQRLNGDPAVRERVNRALGKVGLSYSGKVRVEHLLYILLDDIGLDKIAAAVKRPLAGYRIAPFYGCHLLRPRRLHGDREDPTHPRGLGRLIEALGGKEVQYNGATQCCGFHALVVKPELALQMGGRHLQEAKEEGADFVVTPCPLCHSVLDSYQPRAEHALHVRIGLPVLHLAEMVGLAVGLPAAELGLTRHVVQPKKLLVA